jgi:signal transduction histidine kinase
MTLFQTASFVLASSTLAALPDSPPPKTNLQGVVSTPALTSVRQILELSPKQAEANLPVRIRGTVTCYQHGLVLFVQDETGGVFVYYTGERLPVRAGQSVEVTGVAKPGRYSPIIEPQRIEPVADGPAVGPRPVSLGQVLLGGLDAQWVEFTAVVRSLNLSKGQLSLGLADPPQRVTLWISNFEVSEHPPPIGSIVKVRGIVTAVLDALGHLRGFQIIANTLADIAVLQPGPADPFLRPASLIGDLESYHARRGLTGLAQVRGVVTLCWPGEGVFIQDSTGALEVRSQRPVDDLVPGTLVAVAGFLGPAAGAPLLEDAIIRRLETNAPPQPLRVSSDALFRGRHDGQLVEIEARFLGPGSVASNRLALALQDNGGLVTALVDPSLATGALAKLAPGSRLGVTGVCRREAPPGTEPAVYLLVRSPKELALISPPPSTPRFGVEVLASGVILTTVGMGAALWFLLRQRRRTEHMLELQASLRTEMREGEQQLRRSIEERERIGQDLHDDIIQSIYAVGLSLEDCRRMMRQSPEQAEPRLAAAIQTLNDTISSVRGFIAGLEPKILNGREFKTAVKSLAVTSGDAPVHFKIEVDPAAANRLTSAQATQLLHVAKEAMGNSLHHAQASEITISLSPLAAGVRLEVHDDGVGFDPHAPRDTGLGLRNMTARAQKIGANLEIRSSPGQGCRIVATVPDRKSHEPD